MTDSEPCNDCPQPAEMHICAHCYQRNRIKGKIEGVKKFAEQPPAHRAMDDIKHSLKELTYYVQEIKKLP